MSQIKESKELLKAIELVSVAGIEIAKGGLDASDIAKAIDLIKQFDVIVEGIKGSDQVIPELKDLDQAELLELGVAVFDLVKKIKEASKESV